MDNIVNQIYHINNHYQKMGLMGLLMKHWVRGAMENGNIRYILDEDVVIAFVMFSKLQRKNQISLYKIACHEYYLGMGHAHKLLNDLKEDAKKEQRNILVKVAHTNNKAINWYKRNGFQELKKDKYLEMSWTYI